MTVTLLQLVQLVSEMKDKIILTITLERNVNGTVSRATNMEGTGFHYFELIGLLQMTCYEFAQKSVETAKELPKDKPSKLVFKKSEDITSKS
jgi:hypothetical protein